MAQQSKGKQGFDISKYQIHAATKEVTVTVPDTGDEFDVVVKQLSWSKRNQLISSEDYRHLSSSKLIVSDHPYCVSGSATKDIMNIPFWISKWLREKFLNSKKIKKPHSKKLYIDRGDSKSNTRHLRQIVNEEEIRELLKKNDFEFIQLGKMNFKDQTEIFNNAQLIVGLHGAGFANVCFCEKGTKIVELRGFSSGTQYKNLAIKNGLHYDSISCNPIEHEARNQYGHIDVPVEKLKEVIKI